MPDTNEKLKQLATIMQMFGSMQVGSRDSQSSALQALGLQQQDAWHQGELAHMQAQLEQQAKNEAARQGEYWGGDYQLKQQAIAEQKATQDRMLQQAQMDNYTRLPGATPEGLFALGESFKVPGMAEHNTDLRNTLAQGQAAQMQQALGGVYSQFKDNPHKAQQALDILWQDPRMRSESVQNTGRLRDWLREQNAGIYQAPNPASQMGTGTGAVLGHALRTAPIAVAQGLQNADTSMTNFGSDFWGNLFGLTPPSSTPSQFTPEQLAAMDKRRGIDMLHPLGPWNELFGR